VLTRVGLDAVSWLGEPGWARFSVILVNVWYGAPFFLIMYLAALKSVPEQLYEAAAIDGANWWQKIWYITLPMMRNIIAITVLFSLIVTFANFDIVRILTNGGPIDQTHVFATWAFQLGIEGGDLPLGACVSLFMFPILGVAAYSSCATSTGAGPKREGEPAARAPRGADLVLCVAGGVRVIFLTPPLYMFITSLKTSAEISSAKLPWWVFDPTLDNYAALLTSESYLTFFRNSAVVSLAVVAITMAISIPAAFSLSRMRFWGSGALATGVFLTYLIPETLLFIPLFKIFAFVQDWTGIELMNHWWL